MTADQILSLVVATTVQAAESPAPDLVMSKLAATFPTAEVTTGNQTKLEIFNLTCASSLGVRNHQDILTSTCTGQDAAGRQLPKRVPQAELLLILMAAGLNVDTASEPGTVYVTAESVKCDYIGTGATRCLVK